MFKLVVRLHACRRQLPRQSRSVRQENKPGDKSFNLCHSRRYEYHYVIGWVFSGLLLRDP